MPFANILYREFRDYLVETDESGGWGDKYFHDTFDRFVDEEIITIEYKYADSKLPYRTMLKWRCVNDKGEPEGKVRKVEYTDSSRFAMWWSGVIDEPEEEEDAVEYDERLVIDITPQMNAFMNALADS
tara:strand:- start:126 stop:509 length:384 start_codon:yes stop_codon:yes gene_type:complete